jgi:hypothetical protein
MSRGSVEAYSGMSRFVPSARARACQSDLGSSNMGVDPLGERPKVVCRPGTPVAASVGFLQAVKRLYRLVVVCAEARHSCACLPLCLVVLIHVAQNSPFELVRVTPS